MLGHRSLVTLAKEAEAYAKVGGLESVLATLSLMKLEIDTRLKEIHKLLGELPTSRKHHDADTDW